MNDGVPRLKQKLRNPACRDNYIKTDPVVLVAL